MTPRGTRTIEIDLEVHKVIEDNRESFDETENDILRRLLKLEPRKVIDPLGASGDQGMNLGNGVVLVEGTLLRKRYEATEYIAKVKNRKIWLHGRAFTSPSAAGREVTKYNVNGWRFWQVKGPSDSEWRLLDDLRQ